MSRRSDSHSSGFTLIELLVVIVVIAVLAALLLPVLGKAKTAAHSANCRSNLRQVALGTAMYVGDFSAYPRGLWSPPRPVPPGYWVDQLAVYTRNSWTNDLYRCPGNFLKRVRRPLISGGLIQIQGVLVSGATSVAIGADRDYDINDGGAGGGGIGFQGYNSESLPDGHVQEVQITSPSQMLAFGDSVLIWPNEHTRSGGMGTFTEPSLFSPVAYYRPKPKDSFLERSGAQAKRHNGKFNVVFCDGHTESQTTNQLFGRSDEVMRQWNRDHEPHPEKTWTDTR